MPNDNFNAPRPKPQVPMQQQDPNHHGKHHGGEEPGMNPHMQGQESVAQLANNQSKTAEDIARTIESATQAKLLNKGIPQNAKKMQSMVREQDPEFMRKQQAAQAAMAAAIRANSGEQILQTDTADNFERINAMVRPLDDSAFVHPVDRPTPVFGMEGATGNARKGKKTLSMDGRQDRPTSSVFQNTHNQMDERNAHQEKTAADIIMGQQFDDQTMQSDTTETSKIDKIKVFFVPTTCDTEKMTSEDFNYTHIANGGQEQQIAVSKFRPVVYLKNEEVAGFKPVDIPGIKVKDGYTQVDANEYAKSRGALLKDIMDESGREQMMEHASSQKSRDYQITTQDLSAGTDINDFAISTKDVSLNVPVIADGTNHYNVYDYNLSAIGDGHGATMIKTVLKNIHNTSLESDRRMNPEIYNALDAFDKRCLDKSDIIQQHLPKEERDAAFAKLNAEYSNSQIQRYIDDGLNNDDIERMKDLGYIGVDATRFAAHIAPSSDISSYMKNTSKSNDKDDDIHQIVDGAGKFTISGSNPDTHFGDFIAKHKDDIIDLVGGKLGVSDEESRKHKIHVSTQSISGDVSSCVVVYEGFAGQEMTDVDKAMREAVASMISDYKDNSVRISPKTYAVEKGEINTCNERYANNAPKYTILPYNGSVTLNENLLSTPQSEYDGPSL